MLAFVEYAAIAAALGAHVPRAVSGAAVLAACAAAGGGYVPTEVVLMTALIAIGALAVGSGQPGPGACSATRPRRCSRSSTSACRSARSRRCTSSGGREAVLLLMVVIVVSDSAQYYTGRALRTAAARAVDQPEEDASKARSAGWSSARPRWSLGGRFVFPATGLVMLALVGATVSALGIVGDLFESLLKRSAGVKDSSR